MTSELEAILAESSSDEEDVSQTLSFPGLSVDEILREEEETEERENNDGFEVDEFDDEYSANDAALLQQILREDEEGDEENDDRLLMNSDLLNDAESSLSYGSGGPQASTTSSTPHMHKAMRTSSEHDDRTSTFRDDISHEAATSLSSNKGTTSSLKLSEAATLSTTAAAPPPPAAAVPNTTAIDASPRLWRGERLAAAIERESKLLKTEISSATTSPLQLKRRARSRELVRARPDNENTDPPRNAIMNNKLSRRAAVAGRGAARLEPLASISKQLTKNAQYSSHGPGVASCCGVGGKFVAVGTSRGLALVFDHFEEVRRVLGSASERRTATAVDVRDAFVAVGHLDGSVQVWDVVKGSSLTKKAIAVSGDTEDETSTNGNGSSIRQLRFYNASVGSSDQTLGLVAIDAAGVVTKLCLTKPKMWAALYAAEIECLLDESANVQPGCLTAHGSKLAFSSASASFVVSMIPTVKISHKWPVANALLTTKPLVVVALDPLHDLRLCRGAGSTIDFFQDSTKSKDSRYEPLSLVPEAGGVVAIEWLCEHQESTMVLAFCGDGSARVMDVVPGVQIVAIDMASRPMAGLRAAEGCVYVVSARELSKIRLQTASQRVDALIDAGEWLEALALALDDQHISLESKLDLLQRYVSLAVDNAPVNSSSAQTSKTSSLVDLAKSHFQMLAGVCVEFCVETQRLDVLFSEIFAAFDSLDRSDVFLDVLEPYVLSRKLSNLAPQVMAKFVAHFEARGALVAVERSILKLEVTGLDFNMITALLKTHRLYTALFRVYSCGLDDFVTPLEILLTDARSLAVADEEQETTRHIIDKAILYLRYCLDGLRFPSGDIMEDEQRAFRLRTELILFLLQEHVISTSETDNTFAHLRLLAKHGDGVAVLDLLTVALRDKDVCFPLDDEDEAGANPYEQRRAQEVSFSADNPPKPPAAKTYLRATTSVFHDDVELWKSHATQERMVEFVAGFAVAKTFRNLPRPLRVAIVEHLIRFPKSTLPLPEVLRALDALADVAYLLDVASARPRAGLEIQRFEAEALALRSEDAQLAAQALASALHRYLTLSPDDEASAEFEDVYTFSLRLFSTLLAKYSVIPEPLASAWLQRLSELARRDATDTAKVLLLLCNGGDQESIDGALLRIGGSQKSEDQATQFALLDALLKAHDDEQSAAEKNDMVDTVPSLLSPELEALYVELLAVHEPESMYLYLSSHEGSYSIERCLELCREHGIADATAYLLEQTGDSVGALKLMLGTLRDRFEDLRRALRAANRDGRFSVDKRGSSFLNLKKYGLFDEDEDEGKADEDYDDDDIVMHGHDSTAKEELSACSTYRTTSSVSKLRAGRDAVERLPEGRAATATLDAAVRLCRRHSAVSAGGRDEAWFATLDQLLEAKRALQLSHELPSNEMLMHAMLDDMVRRALAAMSEYLSLPDIVSKILDDHADSNLGDFRDVIVSTLQSTRYDLRIYEHLLQLARKDTSTAREQYADKMHRARIVVNTDTPFTTHDALELQRLKGGEGWIATVQTSSETKANDDYEQFRRRQRALATISDCGSLDPASLQSQNIVSTSSSLSIEQPIAVRVPGMLEHRAKFNGALPISEAPVALVDDINAFQPQIFSARRSTLQQHHYAH